MMNPMTIEGCIFSILLRGENYGLGIVEDARQISDGRVVFAQSVLYSALKRLEQGGWIKLIREDKQPGGGRARRIYGLTKKGRQEAEAEACFIQFFFRAVWPATSRHTDANQS